MAVLTGLFTLGRDAELRHTSGGDAVVTVSLGYNYGRKGQDGRYPTTWVRASIWGKLGESIHTYLTKGKQVDAVLEDVHIRTYDKQDGTEGFNLEARVLKIELTRGQRQEEVSQPAPAPAPAPRQQQRAPAPRQGGSSGFDDMDDSIPFADPMKRRAFALSI